eukprot:4937999-Alexandrium_andersonii.AAC.1
MTLAWVSVRSTGVPLGRGTAGVPPGDVREIRAADVVVDVNGAVELHTMRNQLLSRPPLLCIT